MQAPRVALLLLALGACDAGPVAADREYANGLDFADARFLDRMSAHHERVVALTSAARDRAVHPELRALAASLYSERSGELYDLYGWGEAWFHERPTRTMGEIAATNEEVDRLKAAPDFDLALLDALEHSHRDGLTIARNAQLDGRHPEVRALATQIAKEHAAALRQLSTWRLEWYPGTAKPAL
jgi:uncharacterized protein (DUF305 family)